MASEIKVPLCISSNFRKDEEGIPKERKRFTRSHKSRASWCKCVRVHSAAHEGLGGLKRRCIKGGFEDEAMTHKDI